MKMIPQRPALLVSMLDSMVYGFTKYAAEFGGDTTAMVNSLTSTRNTLVSAMQTRTEAAGIAEGATQNLASQRDSAILVTRRMRDQIYAIFGKNDARIVEFGLDTIRPRTSAGGSVNNGAGGNTNGETTQP